MEAIKPPKIKKPPPKRSGAGDTEQELPTRIEVKQGGAVKNVVPGHVWRCPPFKFNPVTFAAESEQLNDKFIEPHVQRTSLKMFLDNPRLRMIYGVSGNPDDSKAKYFAAFLVAAHIKALGSDANVIWNPMYGNFANPLIESDVAPTMLVLTNLTPNSTTLKLEKTRDLVEKFNDIPRILVVAGMDPLSFLTTRLYLPVNGLAYFAETLVRQRVEVV